MTVEEEVRIQAARGDLSPRRTIIKALDVIDSAKDALIFAMSWDGAGQVSKATLTVAAGHARLAADLLQALAQRAK